MQTNSKAEIFEKIAKGIARMEEIEWSNFSLANALKDIDEPEEEYSEADLKEKWL
ncbi:Uncharacterised protein [uncultured archaeon]|nr:Uncharacterised protein [uncultured archaeon]